MKILICEPGKYFDKRLLEHIVISEIFDTRIEFEVFFPKSLYDIVNKPESADFIIFPHDLTKPIIHLGMYGILGLFDNCNIFQKYYWKFIFIYNEDLTLKIPMGGTWLRSSCDKRILSNESVSIPYFSRNKSFVSTANCKFKANFVGAINTHPIRGDLISYLIKENVWSKILLLIRGEFHGPNIDGSERVKRDTQFHGAMSGSYMTLCPRGTGMSSNRFFETMSLGRVPILITEHNVLPFEEEINYEDFCFSIEYNKLNELVQSLDTKDDDLVKMCDSSYKIYEEYFSIKNYATKLASYLNRNKNKIYESRKKEEIFHCRIEEEFLYDYCYDYLIKYYEAEEFIATVQLAQGMIKLTKDPKTIERTNSIIYDCKKIVHLSSSETIVKYMNGLKKHMAKDPELHISKYSPNSIEDFNALSDIYAEKLLE